MPTYWDSDICRHSYVDMQTVALAPRTCPTYMTELHHIFDISKIVFIPRRMVRNSKKRTEMGRFPMDVIRRAVGDVNEDALSISICSGMGLLPDT